MKTVLSIDDEPEILKCFREALRFKGYECLTASDPDEGLRLMRERPEIDLLLLDVKMPKKNGFEVYREIRSFRALPVLFITAYPNSFNAESNEIVTMWREQFSDGETDILYKPFELEALFDKVAGLIGPADDNAADA